MRKRSWSAFYLLNIVTGGLALAFADGRSVVLSLATLCYVVVTLLSPSGSSPSA